MSKLRIGISPTIELVDRYLMQQRVIDEYRDDGETQIPAKQIFKDSAAIDQKCLSMGLLRERDQKRSPEWARSWCGGDFHLDESSGLKVMESARRRQGLAGSRMITMKEEESIFGEEDWARFDSLVSALSDDTVKTCHELKNGTPHAGPHSSLPTNLGFKSCAIIPRVPSIMTPTPPRYEIFDIPSSSSPPSSGLVTPRSSSESEH